jgi:hypothetical protein
MEYASADPSVVRSIRQRVLLNAWLRALRTPNVLPVRADFDSEAGSDELADVMGFDVEGDHKAARFLITHEGARLAATYGNDHVALDKRTNRYLDDAIGPDATRASWPAIANAWHTGGRPIRSRWCRMPTAKEVSYERLLLPFGNAAAVTQIVGSYKAISIEGGFKVRNLMGLRPMAAPTMVVHAVIDREAARRPSGIRASEDIIEAD